jgi:hypothetical protein
MVSRDKDEITVVTAKNNLNGLDIIEKNKDDYTIITNWITTNTKSN